MSHTLQVYTLFGTSQNRLWSIRPGLSSAGSMRSGRLEAARTYTPVSRKHTLCHRGSLVPSISTKGRLFFWAEGTRSIQRGPEGRFPVIATKVQSGEVYICRYSKISGDVIQEVSWIKIGNRRNTRLESLRVSRLLAEWIAKTILTMQSLHSVELGQ